MGWSKRCTGAPDCNCGGTIDSGGCCYNPDAAHDTIHAQYQIVFPSVFSDWNCTGCSALNGATVVVSQSAPHSPIFTGTAGDFTITLRLCSVTVPWLVADCGTDDVDTGTAASNPPSVDFSPDCNIPGGSTITFFAAFVSAGNGCHISADANATITAL